MACKTAATHAIERESRGLDRQSAEQRGDAREVHVLCFGVDHVSEDDVADFGCREAGPLHSLQTTSAASSLGGISFRAPPNFPIGVRTALKTTTSRWVMSFILSPCPSRNRRRMIAGTEQLLRRRYVGIARTNSRGRIQSTAVKGGRPAKPQTRNCAGGFVNRARPDAVPCPAKNKSGTPSGAVQ